MTALATYTLAANAVLSGVVVRAWATGRYLNNTGGPLSPVISTSYNGITQCTFPVLLSASPVARNFTVRAYFYFTTAITDAGQGLSLGSSMEMAFSNPFASTTVTGGHVSDAICVCINNPYNTFLTPSQQLALALNFTPIGTDVLEVHAGTMEAL